MTLTVLTGAAGAGKTTEVIRIVTDLREHRQRSFLIATLDGGTVRPALEKYDIINARSGRKARVDFKGHAAEIRAFISAKGTAPSTFVFDEAQRFGKDFAEDWIALSGKGHVVIVSTPSAAQLDRLREAGADIQSIRKLCDLMADGDATVTIRLPGGDGTISVCEGCAERLQAMARTHLRDRLVATAPSPGTPEIYQPIDADFPEFAGLNPIRADSAIRAGIMAEFVARHLDLQDAGQKSYIDIGCNSGFFCKRMADLGLRASGIDVARNDIHMGRVADSYIYNRHLDLQVRDALAWVPDMMPEHDVASTFSVYQWLYEKHDTEAVHRSLRALMAKARKLFFFEMGYTDEAHYRDRLPLRIDRDWCLAQMREHGGFAEIMTYGAGWNGLKRDFFVGIKP
ncbi:hypothetical protein H5395_06190 [Paracoccus sp. MC1854]|uniref:DNA/RNA helicase domain-containing protein n=1 Tax=Paracoccus sp. MC1854 TaxID=2760306 RepID=UPI00160459D2|nr:DNA/RNA helicase domain-containing protein [Paracoccus sp. MC1854]MBB1491127.1 hypothetical protein [Paracoccus sp. MC1854]